MPSKMSLTTRKQLTPSKEKEIFSETRSPVTKHSEDFLWKKLQKEKERQKTWTEKPERNSDNHNHLETSFYLLYHGISHHFFLSMKLSGESTEVDTCYWSTRAGMFFLQFLWLNLRRKVSALSQSSLLKMMIAFTQVKFFSFCEDIKKPLIFNIFIYIIKN